jgi:putative transposase
LLSFRSSRNASFLALGPDPDRRAAAYRRWLDDGVDAADLEAIRRHLAQERALGDARFQSLIERALNRPVRIRPVGWPSTAVRATG